MLTMESILLTCRKFAELCGVSPAAISKAGKEGRLKRDPVTGKYDLSHDDNYYYYKDKKETYGERHHTKAGLAKKFAPIPPTPKPPKRRPVKTHKLKAPDKKAMQAVPLSDVEIFIKSLSLSLANSSIPEKEQNKLKKDMIKHAEKIEFENFISVFGFSHNPSKEFKKLFLNQFSKIKTHGDSFIPEENEKLVFFSDESISPLFLLFYFSYHLRKIDEIFLNYYSFGKKASEALFFLMSEDVISKSNVTISTIRNYGSTAALVGDLKNYEKKFPGRFSFKMKITHLKAMGIKAGNKYISIFGSGNISDTNRSQIEQFVIDDGEKTFEVLKKIHEDI